MKLTKYCNKKSMLVINQYQNFPKDANTRVNFAHNLQALSDSRLTFHDRWSRSRRNFPDTLYHLTVCAQLENDISRSYSTTCRVKILRVTLVRNCTAVAAWKCNSHKASPMCDIKFLPRSDSAVVTDRISYRGRNAR